jgi:hypothetical protein
MNGLVNSHYFNLGPPAASPRPPGPPPAASGPPGPPGPPSTQAQPPGPPGPRPPGNLSPFNNLDYYFNSCFLCC